MSETHTPCVPGNQRKEALKSNHPNARAKDAGLSGSLAQLPVTLPGGPGSHTSNFNSEHHVKYLKVLSSRLSHKCVFRNGTKEFDFTPPTSRHTGCTQPGPDRAAGTRDARSLAQTRQPAHQQFPQLTLGFPQERPKSMLGRVQVKTRVSHTYIFC